MKYEKEQKKAQKEGRREGNKAVKEVEVREEDEGDRKRRRGW